MRTPYLNNKKVCVPPPPHDMYVEVRKQPQVSVPTFHLVWEEYLVVWCSVSSLAGLWASGTSPFSTPHLTGRAIGLQIHTTFSRFWESNSGAHAVWGKLLTHRTITQPQKMRILWMCVRVSTERALGPKWRSSHRQGLERGKCYLREGSWRVKS